MELSHIPQQTPHHPAYICNQLRKKYNIGFCNYSTNKIGSSQFEYNDEQVMVELTTNKKGTIIELIYLHN